MIGAGIHHGDLLIVDRSLTPKDRDVVLATFGGEFTVKRLFKRGSTVKLIPENKSFPVIDVSNLSDFEISGVVVHAIKTFK